jgi:hypothetical protein
MLDVKESQLVEAIETVINEGFNSHAMLGSSGRTILLYGEKERVSSISVRLHSSGVEMLICNRVGSFLFYGKFHPKLGSNFIAGMFLSIISEIGYPLILSDRII